MDARCTTIEAAYRQRRDHFAAAEQQCARRERALTHARTVAGMIAVALFCLGWAAAAPRSWFVAAGVAAGVFVVAVVWQDRVTQQRRRNGLLRQINEEAIARLHRDWNALPEYFVEVPVEQQAVADDLDLFGHASLFHLACVAHTPLGIRTLRDWLLEPASPEAIRWRQEAVVELAPELELREAIVLEGRLLADRGNATTRFIEWAEGQPWLGRRPWLTWFVRIVPAMGVLAIVLACLSLVPAEWAAVTVLAVLAVNLATIVLLGGRVHDIFALLNLRRGGVARYVEMFYRMYQMPGSSRELEALKREATLHGGGVLRRMHRLNSLTKLANIRHEPFLKFYVYLPAQFLFLYDFQILSLLETWQTRYGRFVREWFLALGKFESLCSLATLAHDHPGWTMPEVDSAADALRARKLGHPLLPNQARVANDVQIGPAGSFLLVTGSNMSGKSTLLRTVGVNVLLAQAGAPVCAEHMVMPPLVVTTSVRIRDSLEDGVSFYMAELRRLKGIVELARRIKSQDGRRLLYLLDEILLGTNSKERHIAAVRVLGHLIRCGTIGAVSTHDLDLATASSLQAACRCVHFRETLHDEHAQQPMTFDYQLRPGLAPTTNALKLLEIVGLGDQLEGP